MPLYCLDVTYIRCLDPDCTESTQSQLTIANRSSSTRSPIVSVQIVIDPRTNLPVLHLTGWLYPASTSVYMFVACQDVDCDMTKAIYTNYGGARFGLRRPIVSDLFVDDQGTVSAIIRTIHDPTNTTINAVVQMSQMAQVEIDVLTFVKPVSIE